eukprot:NODE_5024_length_990_cov_105.495963_g4816_i0.p1 GENE.NODE_5024_length_990_cov_105.495963_g4816_i0~~NODE_5024_length_990_cov_105.495963_g4816_i0.p1  ORF type:complete len:286 (-),score=58.86 NODE_5024_length_990_cov_105.495963_g4816_i0:132-932(-)
MATYSITFGENAQMRIGDGENVGKSLGLIGESKRDVGFSPDQLIAASAGFPGSHVLKVHEHLPEDLRAGNEAVLLVIPNGVDAILGEGAKERLLKEQQQLVYDQQSLLGGELITSKTRFTAVFDDKGTPADPKAGRGVIIGFDTCPELAKLRDSLANVFGSTTKGLVAEGNHYFDPNCGIDYHGDTDRKNVICVRLGASTGLSYHWMVDGQPLGEPIQTTLNHGDMYVMSEKATGHDWEDTDKKRVYVLHAAGHSDYMLRKPTAAH